MSRKLFVAGFIGAIFALLCTLGVLTARAVLGYMLRDDNKIAVGLSPRLGLGMSTPAPNPRPGQVLDELMTPGNTVPLLNTFTVLDTPVLYVIAQTDVNINRGPGSHFDQIGWVSAGQSARVTGVSADGSWWRILCPNDKIGACWVSADEQSTLPVGDRITPLPEITARANCTDSAALVIDITVPDDTFFMPDTGFTKIWRVENTGTCTWDSSYRLVHTGGHLLGAVSSSFPLSDIAYPGQTIDLAIDMVSPSTLDVYQSDWKLQNTLGRSFGIDQDNSPFWVQIAVVAGPFTTISGTIYQDTNYNGVLDVGEPPVSDRFVWLILGTACHVRSDPVAIAISSFDGHYTFNGPYSGSYCVGLAGVDGLEDVIGVTLSAGQTLSETNLKAIISPGSTSEYLMDDYFVIGGNCDNHMRDISLVDLQGGHSPGTFLPNTLSVLVKAASPGYERRMLFAGRTFRATNIWHQELLLLVNDNEIPVNVGRECRLQGWV